MPLPSLGLMLPSTINVAQRLSLEGALNWEIQQTSPYTGEYFMDEIQGLADATGFSVWPTCPGLGSV
jgi:hypothetical protein